MTHVTCRLTAKNWDQLRNPTLDNRVWATFTFLNKLATEIITLFAISYFWLIYKTLIRTFVLLSQRHFGEAVLRREQLPPLSLPPFATPLMLLRDREETYAENVSLAVV